jgi:hypothetical protein
LTTMAEETAIHVYETELTGPQREGLTVGHAIPGWGESGMSTEQESLEKVQRGYVSSGREPLTLDSLIAMLEEAASICSPGGLIAFERLDSGQIRMLVSDPPSAADANGLTPVRLVREIDVGEVQSVLFEVLG